LPAVPVTDDITTLTTARHPDGWTDLDTRAVDTVRVLAADAVQNVGNGHPGTAMSLAPLAYTLFQRVLRHDPSDQDWIGRDRFVLSCGHSSLTLYIQLYMAGYGLELDDLKALRTWGSNTPGHPEHRHTPGIEITTGPLGQGLASAVGMAMAARRERGLFDPDAAPGESPFDHHVFVIASDGDIEEGVTSEASSIAGHQQLGNLVLVYDDNKISIEDDTDIAISEDVAQRYEAYGWHVQVVQGGEDVAAIEKALLAAKAETGKPSLILLRTIIGFPAPKKMNTGGVHGSALGDDEVAAVKEALGFDPEQTFEVADKVLAHVREIGARGRAAREAWTPGFDAWADREPERKALLDRVLGRTLPDGYADALPTWEPGSKAVATRKASEAVLAALGPVLPELWGGSADLAGSNNTTIDGADSFGPASISTDKYTANPYGRTLHFGVREHAMAAILNGIALHGPTRPYGGTFLVFSDYQRPAVRIGALMKSSVVHVWTHDSIGLGEDGPTHQPVEHLSALRAIPGLDVVRPGDANETAAAWKAVLERPEGDVAAGPLRVVLIGTGSELQIAVAARETLEAQGIGTRVVSMPCQEWFDAQPADYRDTVLPPLVRARVAVEAGIAMSWHRFTGTDGEVVSLEHFGASADYQTLYREFGITDEAVVAAAQRSLARLEA